MAWVLSSLTGFFQRRRRALVLATSVVGGAYVVGKYAVDRIRDTQQRLVAERRDKENLRRRFAQNQDDCTFTTLALLPALAAQILAALNVEDLTAALQRRKRAPPQPQPQPVQPIHQPRHPESHLEQTGGPTEQDGSSSQQPGGSKQSAAPTLAAPAPAQNGAHLPPSGLPGAEAERPADLTDSAQIAKAHPVGGADGEHARASAQQTAADAALDQDQAASPAQEPKPPQPVLPATTAAAMRNAPMLMPTPTPAHPHDPASDPPERSGSTAEEPDVAVLQAHPALPAAGAASEASRVAESNDSLDEPTAKGDSGADVGGPTSASVEETPPQVNGAAPEQVHDASVKGESNHSSPNRPHGERQNREEEVEEEKEVVVAVQQQEQQENEEEAPLSAEERARLEAATAAAKAEAAARAEAEREAVEEAKMRERQETLALWNELKVVSLSQAVTSVYGIVLLTLQTHIMLNLIGRYSYLASVVSMGERPPQDAEGMEDEALEAAFDAAERMDSPPAPADRDDDGSGTGAGAGAGIDPHTERLYLTFSWWLLHRGWDRLAQRVRGAVESTFGQLSIMSPLSWHDFDRLLRSVRRKVEYDVLPPLEQEAYAANFSFGFGDDLHSSALSEVSGTTRGSRRLLAKRRTFLDVLFPTTAVEEAEVVVEGAGYSAQESARVMAADPALHALLNESKDLVESPDFRLVQRLALDAGFVALRSGLRGVFGLPPLHADGSEPALPLPGASARFHELTAEEESMFFTSGAGKKVKLAQLFPVVARLSKLAFQGAPNEYVEAVTSVKELRAFSAVIYSSWPKAPVPS